jgi:hypothetical protein
LVKLACIKNKFVLGLLSDASYNEKVYKLLRIDLNDFTSKQMNLDGKVLSFAYLESGYLVLGGEIMTIWRTDCWPFEKIDQSQETFKRPIYSLLALYGEIFAGAFEKNVCIWNKNLKLLHEIKMSEPYCKLKIVGNFILMIEDMFHKFDISKSINISFYNFRSGESLKKLQIYFHPLSLFKTPDKEFLVIAGEKKLLVYHLKGAYVCSEFETSQRYQFQNEEVELLENRKFAQKIDSKRSLLVFDYEE